MIIMFVFPKKIVQNCHNPSQNVRFLEYKFYEILKERSLHARNKFNFKFVVIPFDHVGDVLPDSIVLENQEHADASQPFAICYVALV